MSLQTRMAMTVQAIVNATVIDGTGRPPFSSGVILANDGRIFAVGDESVSVPSGSRLINATCQYVIPGLMDANVHLISDFWPLTLVRHEDRLPELAIEAAQVALRAGVTTVFDSWGPRTALCRA